jgi:hypothetical protein
MITTSFPADLRSGTVIALPNRKEAAATLPGSSQYASGSDIFARQPSRLSAIKGRKGGATAPQGKLQGKAVF